MTQTFWALSRSCDVPRPTAGPWTASLPRPRKKFVHPFWVRPGLVADGVMLTRPAALRAGPIGAGLTGERQAHEAEDRRVVDQRGGRAHRGVRGAAGVGADQGHLAVRVRRVVLVDRELRGVDDGDAERGVLARDGAGVADRRARERSAPGRCRRAAPRWWAGRGAPAAGPPPCCSPPPWLAQPLSTSATAAASAPTAAIRRRITSTSVTSSRRVRVITARPLGCGRYRRVRSPRASACAVVFGP